jgi:SAM-dependent methyltransferase
MSLRFHEIAETNHRILNPFTAEKLMLLGEICRLDAETQQLDLCCGKAEMLCRWSKKWGIRGTGVDISSVFIDAARKRALELGVDDQLTFIEGDAARYPLQAGAYDVVSCIGATWIGDGLVGTIKLMQPALKENGLLLVGEPYWIKPPTETVLELMGFAENDYTSLVGTLDRIESTGMELLEMVLASQDSWDRYTAAQWLAIDDWLRANPDDPDAEELRAWNAGYKRLYLEYQRDCFGWGVFVTRMK